MVKKNAQIIIICCMVSILGLVSNMSVSSLMAAGSHPVYTASMYESNPPFISSADIYPNLLLIIDNSASMFDLAYTDSSTDCYDDSFSAASGYAGYFDQDTWYYYNSGSEKFVSIDSGTALTAYGSATHKSAAAFEDTAVFLGVDTTTPSIIYFAAKGKFLNWAAASKLDIEKEILTGGKYDSANGHLVMENRGCLNRRSIKKISLLDGSGNTFYLTLGIRGPSMEHYDDWADSTAYSIGDIVRYVGDSGTIYYLATNAATSNGTNPTDDTGVTWMAAVWKDGVTLPAGSIITDPSKQNTYDEGTLYITAAGGITSGTGVDDDSGVTDWTSYNTTQIEVFEITATGFDNAACQAAVDELAKESPNQGQLKQYIDDCMGYSSGGGNTTAGIYNAIFNQSIHNCWYNAKHGEWPPGAGSVSSMENHCEDLYDDGIDPWGITTDSEGYACYGLYYDDGAGTVIQEGYVGRCWEMAGVITTVCKASKLQNGWDPATSCTPADDAISDCCQNKNNVWEVVGGGAGGWISDECVSDALKDYCGGMEIPEVIDPSGEAGASGEFWNLPAVLIDSGAVSQLGKPLLVMNGHVSQLSVPSGIIQEYDDDIRMGAMIFNDEGSDTECDAIKADFVKSDCDDASNKDGGKIISYIDQSAAHTTDLVTAINNIKANTWTPLAEAMFNAIGYYTQQPGGDRRLDAADYITGTENALYPDPVTAWCQNNNILIITEGSSTTDINSKVKTFVDANNDEDTEIGECGSLKGSSYLDDLTDYAYSTGASMFTTPQLDGNDKQAIKTYVVVSGSYVDDDDWTGECKPEILLTNAASQGGTTVYQANDVIGLEKNLREAFSAIGSGTSSGTAASVISNSRSGEGALYQSLFFPEYEGKSGNIIKWAGEVHSLFMDSYGNIREDTNGNKKLDLIHEDTDLDGDGALSVQDRIIVYALDAMDNYTMKTKRYLDANNDSIIDDVDAYESFVPLNEVNYVWTSNTWLNKMSDANALTQRSYGSTDQKRYIFTFVDKDQDMVKDSGEQVAFSDTDPAPAVVDLTDAAKIYPYVQTYPISLTADAALLAETQKVIRFTRGVDQAGYRSRQVDYDGDSTLETWRLGDIVNSTPTYVGRPPEGYHLLYGDDSYGAFLEQYMNRRGVIYLGANDGMIRAFNCGFYDGDEKAFTTMPDPNPDSKVAYTIGSELWAYVPYNLLPHMYWLTQESYEHIFYCDLKPRIFDARIFPVDADHPAGWGTVMVVGMRFGGGDITVDIDNDPATHADTRIMRSSYCIFDITNPEAAPELLGEINLPGMGYTTCYPTAIPMENGTSKDWYLVFGSGPVDTGVLNEFLMFGNRPTGDDALEFGTSNQPGNLYVISLNKLATDKQLWALNSTGDLTNVAAPVPVNIVASNDYTFLKLSAANSFISDPISVDYNFDYNADVAYFGTVSGSDTFHGGPGWGGKMRRIVIDNDTTSTNWIADSVFLDSGKPITAAPSVAIDNKSNRWVYFGTGRYFVRTDGTNTDQQGYCGLKEPSDASGGLTWAEIINPAVNLFLSSDYTVYEDGYALDASNNVTTWEDINITISDTADGWYYKFSNSNTERNLGQAALLGDILTFTTYMPSSDICSFGGSSNLYSLHYLTGTAYYKAVIGTDGEHNFGGDIGTKKRIKDWASLGSGGLALSPNLHVGRAEGSKAFVQTSTGAIETLQQLTPGQTKSGKNSWREIEK